MPFELVDVCGSQTVQRMNLGQPLPNPNKIPPRKCCAAALSDIEMRVEAEEREGLPYVARWDELGYYTLEQLHIMMNLLDARASFRRRIRWTG